MFLAANLSQKIGEPDSLFSKFVGFPDSHWKQECIPVECIPTHEKYKSPPIFFTICNVFAARLRFHRCLSFCSQGWPWPDTPLGRHPPGQNPPPADNPPRTDTPLRSVHAGIHPPPSACWDTHPAQCMLYIR